MTNQKGHAFEQAIEGHRWELRSQMLLLSLSHPLGAKLQGRRVGGGERSDQRLFLSFPTRTTSFPPSTTPPINSGKKKKRLLPGTEGTYTLAWLIPSSLKDHPNFLYYYFYFILFFLSHSH